MILRTTAVSLTIALLGAVPSGLPAPPGGPARTVTLITGDRVSLIADGVRVAPGKGRKGVVFSTEKIGDRLRVVPGDAVPLLAAGRLDPRLFDVTTLLEYAPGALPLIVAGPDAARRPGLAAHGMAVTRDLPAVNGAAVRFDAAAGSWPDLRASLSTGTGKIWLDGRATLSLDASVKQIGAPAAWEKGHTGAGVKVAVLDSGIDDTHPDLAGKVAARRNFTGTDTAADLTGHGTHVASTIAGTGERYRGVAPGATLLDAKVCADRWCAESAILAGMQWAAEQGAKVANLSLGSPDAPGLDPLEEAVQTLTERYGVLFVVAAGNYGKPGTVASPSTADAALSVGAVDRADRLAVFSSTGPRVGDSALKPDITAPGVAIRAAHGKDSPGEGPYVEMSGTSMAAPHTAGSAAILAGLRPDWTPEQLKAALMATARPQPGTGIYAQGAGRLDVGRAIGQTVTTSPASVGFGVLAWPHDDDEPVTRKLAYRNDGPEPVTLRLSARAAADVFEVSPGTLTVPAGGRAEATVTADTRGDVADGPLGGYLEATAENGTTVSTPLAVVKEVESYDLTLDRPGAADVLTTLYRTDVDRKDWNPVTVQPGGRVTLRLAKGTYLVDSRTTDGGGLTMLVHPGLRLDRDQSLRLDPAQARPVSITPPDPAARHLMTEVTYSGRTRDGSPYYLSAEATMFDAAPGIRTAQVGSGRYDLLTKVAGQWAVPGPDGDLAGSAQAYRLAWFVQGQVPTGFSRRVGRADLATIRRDYGAPAPGTAASAAGAAWPAEGRFFSIMFVTDFRPPFTHTEYVNTGGGLRWLNSYTEMGPTWEGDLTSTAFRYEAGRAYDETWNRGVFGPAPVTWEGTPPVSRAGDVISAFPSLYADGAGHLGLSSVSGARTALYRDGELVAEEPGLGARFGVPAGEAAYRLEVEAERGPEIVSTRTAVAWTFRSAGGRDGALPLPVVAFSPSLDAASGAPAGRAFAVPVSVRGQAGAVRELSVDVSYDDGRTWRAVKVAGGAVRLRHPAAAGFVSLRARAADAGGNTVEQTVIHAYRIR
ncbi:S8 family serine peptidase [Nonomuraea sp. NPDC051191]|uniref:S8 family serine peptidase n=1 Tax=Nonomuraea sp. NPDC051191 TaxID=3364372 RepID=UPI0037ABE908